MDARHTTCWVRGRLYLALALLEACGTTGPDSTPDKVDPAKIDPAMTVVTVGRPLLLPGDTVP